MSADGFDPRGLDDEQLLDLLGRTLAATDPVPDGVIAGALGAETWRTIDAELAELVFDSALEATGTRAAGPGADTREVTFRAGDVEIELLVPDSPDGHLEGQVVPALGDRAELVSLSGAGTAPVDELGRFRFTSVPTGPVRLGIQLPGGWVHTSWVVLLAS